jgi:hypothetical protein
VDNDSSRLFGSSGSNSPKQLRPRPPAVQLAREAVDVDAVRRGSPAAIQREIEKLIEAIRPQGHLPEWHGDGSLRLSSMNAVFALAVLDAAIGGGALRRLRGRTTPADFRNSATLAALVGRLLHTVRAA